MWTLVALLMLEWYRHRWLLSGLPQNIQSFCQPFSKGRVAHGYERPASVCMYVCVCVCHREILATARLFAGALGDCWDWVRVRIA